MRKAFRLVAALVLCLLLAVQTLSAAAADGESWERLEYVRFDPEPFRDEVRQLEKLAAGTDGEAVTALYERLYGEYEQLYTMTALCYIHAGLEPENEYWIGEASYCFTLETELRPALLYACRQVMDGPCAGSLGEYVGPDAAAVFAAYEPPGTWETELTAREAELTVQYAALREPSFSYEGREWTFDALSRDGSLSQADRRAISDGLCRAFAQDAAPIFTQLVSVRTELARSRGYDDYNAYAYERLCGRDYGPDRAQALFDRVKAFSRQYAATLYDSPVLAMQDAVSGLPDDGDELVALLGDFVRGIDPALGDVHLLLSQRRLYELGGRPVSSYTTDLPSLDGAFIFISAPDGYERLAALTHEFGHFACYIQAPAENLLTAVDDLDLAELHGTALELLALPSYGEIYSGGADVAAFSALHDVLALVTEDSRLAEFELRVYERPDMTAEEMAELYARLGGEYGFDSFGGEDYGWALASALVYYPAYTASYSVSALGALQLWELSRQDRDAAARVYMDILSAGCADQDYFRVLERAGLTSFEEPGGAEDVCAAALAELTRMETAVLSP